MDNFTYFIAATEGDRFLGYFKIGFSKNWKSRLEHLQRMVPFEITPIWVVRCDGTELEMAIKNQYKVDIIRGEWFHIPDHHYRPPRGKFDGFWVDHHSVQCDNFIKDVGQCIFEREWNKGRYCLEFRHPHVERYKIHPVSNFVGGALDAI